MPTKQTDALMDDALGTIRETFLEFEKKRVRVVDRLRNGRATSREIYGRCEGGKPFGHYPGESLTLATITCSRKLGMTYKQIAEMLNCRRIPSRSGRPWSGPVIAKILRREAVALVKSNPKLR